MSNELPLSSAAWVAQLSSLPLARIEVRLRLNGSIMLAAPACSVVRGLLGERLRDLRCSTRAPDCSGCAELVHCDYARVFEGHRASPAIRQRDAQPFWLQGVPAASELPGGAEFTARLVAAGPALDVLPYLDVALRDALSRLGTPRARRYSGRHAAAPTLSASVIEAVRWPATARDGVTGALQLEALTPILLRGDVEEAQRMAPRAPLLAICARAAVRRLDALLSTFSDTRLAQSPRFEFPSLSAAEVANGSSFRRWQESRFSRRQGRRMPLQGVTGTLLVQGPGVSELVPLFAALEVVSLGKATTMGFGHVRVSAGYPSLLTGAANLVRVSDVP